jgi:hypothetical protein
MYLATPWPHQGLNISEGVSQSTCSIGDEAIIGCYM